jgi:hypothetical protein
MTDRRQFIKTLAGVPPLLALQPAFAAPDPTRVALIIGNAAYKQAPLENPTNDAAAMRDLFTSAGFTTDSLLNAKRTDLLAAIDRFTTAVQKSETKQALFYYAGHGAQLDWRNYLLPVDIAVKSPEDVKNQCVDLGIILGRLSKLKDKTFIIILDACRDDPFKGAYRPEQKGLSQFDAPVGSLLAYATSPGNVAADGTGKNGLYTENLVRELSNRSAKIEDALKRVRLSVRLGSEGEQIPWETTSLESDVFIFPDGNKKLSEAELEKLIEEEMAVWTQLKNSKKTDDWVAYLRQYPNGRFAEIAQTRLVRLLAATKKPSPAAVAVATTAIPAVVAEVPKEAALIIKPGSDMSLRVQASANPNSAGRFPLGKKFTVGDEVEFRHSDILTGVVGKTSHARVTLVDEDNDRIEMNNGEWVLDLMGNPIRAPGAGTADMPRQFNPAELQVGYKWTAAWKQEHPKFGQQVVEIELKITAFEEIEVPAGRFHAFRIEDYGWVMNQGIQSEGKRWIIPGFNFTVKTETIRRRQGRLMVTERIELVSATQFAFGAGCTSSSGSGKSRTLMIRNSCSG